MTTFADAVVTVAAFAGRMVSAASTGTASNPNRQRAQYNSKANQFVAFHLDSFRATQRVCVIQTRLNRASTRPVAANCFSSVADVILTSASESYRQMLQFAVCGHSQLSKN